MATTGLKPETARPGGKDDRVLFGDADVERPGPGYFAANSWSPVPSVMAAVMARILGVGVPPGEDRLAEDRRIGRDRLVIQRLARGDVERPRAVEPLGVALGRARSPAPSG